MSVCQCGSGIFGLMYLLLISVNRLWRINVCRVVCILLTGFNSSKMLVSKVQSINKLLIIGNVSDNASERKIDNFGIFQYGIPIFFQCFYISK